MEVWKGQDHHQQLLHWVVGTFEWWSHNKMAPFEEENSTVSSRQISHWKQWQNYMD